MKKYAITSVLAACMMLLSGCQSPAESAQESSVQLVETQPEKPPIVAEAPEESASDKPEEKAPDSEKQPDESAEEAAAEKAANVQPPKVKKLSVKEATDFRISYMDFMSELMQKANNETGNTCISAYSIEQAFGMLLNGADGNTKKEIEKVFHTDTDTMNSFLYQWRTSQPDDADCFVKTANAIFQNEDLTGRITLREEYLNHITGLYGGKLSQYSFSAQGVEPVNTWVKENTDGKIKKLLDKLDEKANSVLVNASLFEAVWKEDWKYDEEYTRQFTDINGVVQDIPFMSSSDLKFYYECKGIEAFLCPYKNPRYAFVGILPAGGANDFVKDMDADKLQKILSDDNKIEAETYAYMPEFKYDTEVQLGKLVQEMGMKDAFSESDANFRKMADFSADANIWINSAIHKTHIEVDHKGTKAAAATAIGSCFNESIDISEPHYIKLDRPFVYMIYDTEMQLPLFFGTVNVLN